MSLWSAQKQEQWLSENVEKGDNKYQGYWYFPVVLNFEPVDKILWCYHSNESYWAVLYCGTVYYAEQGGSNFLSLWMKSYGVTIQMKATEQYFLVVLFILLCKVVLTFDSMNEILNSCHVSKSN